MKIRGFLPVIESKREENQGYIIPRRSTAKSAAYDMCAITSHVLMAGEQHKFYSNIKAYMQDDEVLLVNIRSSVGLKNISIVNCIGMIDSDYFSNVKNDGNIIFVLENKGNQPFIVNPGDRLVQAMFTKYLVADEDNADGERTGGVGSTGR